MGISNRGTKAKIITSCDNAFVTNIECFICSESEAAAANVLPARKRSGSGKCFTCAKAKRQRQSAQPERKSTPHYGDDFFGIIKFYMLLFATY
ncbi:hypothetical protein [Lysinibacillus sp. NPDC093692]|uniref:hypothetical protein n=1 Tax=Lysinibacillus sp. NPDC093692 TaxID=3390578 RepID=UPI003CFDC0A6